MATVQSTLALQDKFTPTLSKIERQAIQQIQTFEKMSREVDNYKKSLEAVEKSNPKIVESEMYLKASDGLYKMEDQLYKVATGQEKFNNNNDNMTMSIIEANQALELLNKAWSVYIGLLKEANKWMEANNKQFDSEYTLGTKMHTTLGANSAEIQSMYDYTAALQKNGVIGDEILMQGAKMLATSASNTENLKELTRAAADVAVAEYGIQDAASGYTSISHYMQRALEGSASMFVRNGILTKQEAKYIDSLKDKTAKENALLKAFNKYLGQNSKAAKTAQGQIKQMNNRLGDVSETLGKKVTPYFAKFKQLLVGIVEPIADFIAQNEWLIPVITSVGIAIGGLIIILTSYIAISKLAEMAAYALGVAEGAAIWPITLLIIAIAALIGVLVYLWETNDKVAYGLIFAWDVIRVGMGVAVSAIKAMWLGLVTVVGGVLSFIVDAVQLAVNAIQGVYNVAAKVVNAFGGNMQEVDYADFGKKFSDAYGNYVGELSADLTNYWGDSVLGLAGQLNQSRQGRVDDRFKFVNLADGLQDLLGGNDSGESLKDVMGTDSTGGKAIKTTTNDKLLSDEDIQLLLDVATRDYKLNYQQITPNITLTFGDVRETADVDDILDKVADRLEEIYEGNLEVSPA